jgi:Mrp family chromosome partitioning ATPase
VSNYLSGMVSDYHDIIVKDYFYPGFDIVPAGIVPPNPAELLLSDNLKLLLDKLRAEYDYIFIDCTPVDLVADAVIAGKLADLTIFIVREGLLDRRMLPEIEKLYNSDKFNSMAMLLNGVRRSLHYGYRHYGKYGNYYS